jgi:pimeloyl-ACP methyl ester carboxylesterase
MIQKIIYLVFTKSYGLYFNILGLFSAKKASEKAFKLFSQPRKGKLNPKLIPNVLQEPRLETFNFEKNIYQIYIWSGSDEIILLVHGWESNSSRWKKLLPFLKKTGKTIISIDAPAHGLSSGKEFTVANYAKVLSELTKKYNPKFIIGHSIGGLASIYYQYLNQNKYLEKLVLLGTPADFQIIVNNYCHTLSLNSIVKSELELRFSEKFSMKLADFSGAEFANSIETKTLIIHDNLDQVVSVNEGKKIAKTMINAQFVITNDLGHALHDKKLYQKIASFLLETNV